MQHSFPRASRFTVDSSRAGDRLDRYLAEQLADMGLSREKIKGHIRQGRVLVNGLAAVSLRRILREADEISVLLPPPSTRLAPETGRLEILHQDECLAVLNKPAGLIIHPGAGVSTGTLAHRLVAHFPSLAAPEGFRPGIVHRLDKDTSGLLLVALTEKTRLDLAALFAGRKVDKEYLALVRGVPGTAGGTIDAPLGRHPRARIKMAVVAEDRGGKPARSIWRMVYADPEGRFALLAVRILTGRTHQIRVHLARLGHPLLGDSLYGPAGCRAEAAAPRQMLHAWKIALDHPCTGRRMRFACPLPDDFLNFVHNLGSRTLRVVVTGSPGCGKSALTRALAALGTPVFSADAEIAALYQRDKAGWQILRSRYGDRFVPGGKGPVDKAALGRAMRESGEIRREVEALLHPLVRAELEAFWSGQEAQGALLALAEVPLYLEAGFFRNGARPDPTTDEALAALLNVHPHRPLLLGVSCPFALRRERILRTRGWSEAVINSMEAWQWPEEKKMAGCDLVLDNSGSEAALEAAAGRLTIRLLDLRESRARLLAETIRGYGESVSAATPCPSSRVHHGSCAAPFP
ncbi:MAG: dephospho-CoA kinase [Desulfovibrio sp.]|jgi:23S rRNA pseudouridine1911/1915/1917 synthase|nr:dephospho-CoA kinase [Desulfovibrio sp.]